MHINSLLITFAGAAAVLINSMVVQAAPAPARAEPFSLGQVRLLDGGFTSFKQAQALDGKYLLSLDPERLLHVFRLNAGLPSTAQPLGGWESPAIELRGHFVGHYLSACALMYAGTGDERFKQRADYLVGELAKCQQKLGGKYLSAFPESFFDRLEAGQRVWAPYYTIHKIMAGLLDVNQLCGNAQALEVVNGMADYFKGRIDKLSDQQMAVVMKTEFGGMMEVLANLSAVTGNADQLALAKRFDDHIVFDPLAARQDKLTGLHANTQIPKMTGAARVFELEGGDRYGTIADYFWNEVTGRRSFVTGSNSFSEHFRKLGLEAGELIPNTAETCNTYNMLKLTRHLFEWEPKAEYADYYERAIYNHILASIDPDSGMMLYFLSLRPGHFKVYNTPVDSFWCCTGTGVENHAKYGDSIYFHDKDALWVNLFIPSELTWTEKGLTIRQETLFPERETTTLSFKAAAPARLTLHLRVPYWATRGITLKINGEPQNMTAPPQSYLSIDREWRDGDRVEYTLPMSLHLHRASDLPNEVAVMYGPVVLAGELGRENMPPSEEAHEQNQYNNTRAPRVPLLVTESADLDSWLKPVEGKPLTFITSGAGKPDEVELTPLYRIHHARYTVYWKTLSPSAWSATEQQLKAADDKRRAEDARTIDTAGLGEEQPERDHHLEVSRARANLFQDRFSRDISSRGWISFELKVEPAAAQVLRCTYWGGDAGSAVDISIDGKVLATETLSNTKPENFFDVEYPIPSALVQGKEKITVRIEAQAGKTARVFDCRIMRATAG